MLSHVSASASGAATIRAFGASTRTGFVLKFVKLLDLQQQATFAGNAATQWFSLRLRLMGVLVLFFTTGSLILLRGAIPSGLVGLAVSYGLVIEDIISSLVFYWQWVENSMVAPERILQYADIEPESDLHQAPAGIQAPSPTWPERGAVQFQNVVMAYAKGLPCVLQHLSFRAEAGWMVGIVGRTGAGKSSIAAALFRLVELRSGSIRIDGVDIASLPLHTLRRKLAIVSQDPVLFAGPLRSYLDPFGEHEDEQIWRVLELVNLRKTFFTKAGGLRYALAEDGGNVSQGQRQLVALARVLLCQVLPPLSFPLSLSLSLTFSPPHSLSLLLSPVTVSVVACCNCVCTCGTCGRCRYTSSASKKASVSALPHLHTLHLRIHTHT